MGGVSRQNYAGTLPPHRFSCVLDELPLHLIPQRARPALSIESAEGLILNPECIVCSGTLPEGLAASPESIAAFALEGSVAWVPDGAGGGLLPFWLGPELEAVVRGLQTAELSVSDIAHEARTLLREAEILIPGDYAAQGATGGDASISRASALFQDKGYAPIANLIHPFHIAGLRRYYRQLIRTGVLRLGDRQSPLRYGAYNEPVARFFHQHIAKRLRSVVGEAIKPSYVYMASYLSGAELDKHTDREQCEFSVTLCVDFSPEPVGATPWPIQLDTSGGSVKVYQAVGDGLAYRGTQLPHYRDRLGEGQTSTSIFFHYVREDFEGSLE